MGTEGQANTDENQNNAIISAVSNDITYIWGPPGTGKTTVIGQIVENLFKNNLIVIFNRTDSRSHQPAVIATDTM